MANLEDLVKKAKEVVERLTALPVNEEDEQDVDDLVRRTSKSRTGRRRSI